MSAALVSILIPTYNRAGLIGEAIRSALAQTYQTIEVIVVDNASTDTTWQEIQDIAKTDARVRAFRNETNIGPVRNWIECARQAKGVYAKILWSDDLIEKTYLDKVLPVLANQNVGFVYTAAKVFVYTPDEKSNHFLHNNLASGIYNSSTFISGILMSEPFPVSPGCAIFRTSDLQKNLVADIPNSVGSDFSHHAIGNDLLLLLLTAQSYKSFGIINEPLSFFRHHHNSISVKSGQQRLVIHYSLVKSYFAQRYIADKAILSKFNVHLQWQILKYNTAIYKIYSINDFYVGFAYTKKDYIYFIKRSATIILKKIFSAHKNKFLM